MCVSVCIFVYVVLYIYIYIYIYICINMFVLCIRKITRNIKEALELLEILPDVFQVVKLLAQLKNLG